MLMGKHLHRHIDDQGADVLGIYKCQWNGCDSLDFVDRPALEAHVQATHLYGYGDGGPACSLTDAHLVSHPVAWNQLLRPKPVERIPLAPLPVLPATPYPSYLLSQRPARNGRRTEPFAYPGREEKYHVPFGLADSSSLFAPEGWDEPDADADDLRPSDDPSTKRAFSLHPRAMRSVPCVVPPWLWCARKAATAEAERARRVEARERDRRADADGDEDAPVDGRRRSKRARVRHNTAALPAGLPDYAADAFLVRAKSRVVGVGTLRRLRAINAIEATQSLGPSRSRISGGWEEQRGGKRCR
ncbi:hypothetical protein Q5752_006290 [Cryptotrichosporon argae]